MGVQQLKKIVLVMSILLAGTILSACVSIPLGDSGKLVISMEGINIEANDAEEVMAEGDIEVVDEAVVEGKDGLEACVTVFTHVRIGSIDLGKITLIGHFKATYGQVNVVMRTLQRYDGLAAVSKVCVPFRS